MWTYSKFQSGRHQDAHTDWNLVFDQFTCGYSQFLPYITLHYIAVGQAYCANLSNWWTAFCNETPPVSLTAAFQCTGPRALSLTCAVEAQKVHCVSCVRCRFLFSCFWGIMCFWLYIVFFAWRCWLCGIVFFFLQYISPVLFIHPFIYLFIFLCVFELSSANENVLAHWSAFFFAAHFNFRPLISCQLMFSCFFYLAVLSVIHTNRPLLLAQREIWGKPGQATAAGQ